MAGTTVEERLIEKLKDVDQRFCSLEEQMNDPAVASNPARIVALSKERGKLDIVVRPFRQMMKLDDNLAQAKEMTQSDDAEMRQMAHDEIAQLTAEREKLFDEIKSALVTSEDYAINSIIVEIRAGTGGDEAALFAGDLLNMYVRYAETRGFATEVMDASETELGGFREIVLNIKGPGVYCVFGYESGGHRVQRVPKTETQGRIHTSAATVAVLPEPEEIEIEIKESDVVESVCRAGGPGGQNVNKVSSAIRLEHIPSGIVVSMRDERSQHKNRAKAWRILKLRLYERMMTEKKSARDQQRSLMIGSGDRSQRIRTYNFPQNRISDHRINTNYNLDTTIVGNMDALVADLQTYDRELRLKTLEI